MTIHFHQWMIPAAITAIVALVFILSPTRARREDYDFPLVELAITLILIAIVVSSWLVFGLMSIFPK